MKMHMQKSGRQCKIKKRTRMQRAPWKKQIGRGMSASRQFRQPASLTPYRNHQLMEVSSFSPRTLCRHLPYFMHLHSRHRHTWDDLANDCLFASFFQRQARQVRSWALPWCSTAKMPSTRSVEAPIGVDREAHFQVSSQVFSLAWCQKTA